MDPLFLSLLALFISLTDAGFQEEFLNSTWGVVYRPIEESFMQSVQIYSVNGQTYLTDTDLSSGTIARLTDGGMPTNGYPVQDGDIVDADNCVVPTDLDYYQNEVLEYIITFTESFEIYRADVVFAWDFPGGNDNGYYVPAYTDGIWMETDDSTPIYSSADYFDTGYHDYKVWQSPVPSSSGEVKTTSSLSFSITGGVNCFNTDKVKCTFRVCEIIVYGYLVTQAPTSEPTVNPVSPSNSPTLAPSSSPTSTPSAAPSAAPTPDICPDFSIKQPCCADKGGYEYVNYTYNRVTDQVVPDADVDTGCLLQLNDSNCCGNDTYTLEVTFSEELNCVDNGNAIATGVDAVCGVDLLVNRENSTWFGYEGVSGVNTEYGGVDYSTQSYTCACNYVLNVCEIRRELSCFDSDLSYENDYELCATDDAQRRAFVGGDEIHILTYYNASIDDSTEQCECNYIGDNCLDDTEKEELFDDIALFDDNDTCTINFIQDCCIESDLAFGGVEIAQLDLESYVDLAENSSNIWECMDGAGLCDGPNVPTWINGKQSFFSWVYNEADGSDIGFTGNSVCECLITYDNCSTSDPTRPSTSPTTDPTLDPTLIPTLSPTNYQFTDFKKKSVIQPCCADHTATIAASKCPDDSPLCDIGIFEGNSDHIVLLELDNSSNCSCSYEIGFWNWNIPSSPPWLQLDGDIWIEILDNITWQNTSHISGFENRRLLSFDTSCFDVYASDCDNTQECISSDAPITSDIENTLQNIGQTMETWTEWTVEMNNCYCYWMYYICFAPETTSVTETTLENVSNATSQTTTAPMDTLQSTQDDDTNGIQALMDDAIALIVSNYIYSAAAGIGLCCACCMLCLVCIKKRKKKGADVDRKQLEESQSPQGQGSKAKLKQTKGKDTSPKAGPLSSGDAVRGDAKAQYSPVPPQDAAIEMQDAPVQHEVYGVEDEAQLNAEDGVYAFVFDSKPFGLTFGKNKADKKNLYITDVDENTPADGNVSIGSRVIGFEDENVEGLGVKKIFEIFSGKYGDTLPLKITFQRPEIEEREDAGRQGDAQRYQQKDEENDVDHEYYDVDQER